MKKYTIYFTEKYIYKKDIEIEDNEDIYEIAHEIPMIKNLDREDCDKIVFIQVENAIDIEENNYEEI